MTRTSQDWAPAAVRQAAIERAHRDLVVELGEDPTVRELADRVGLAPSTISLQLRRMRATGLDIRTRGPRASRRCPHCGEWS
ncbi:MULTISPECIES: winged helix-turn-helix domain-containing protein [unclassified Streptomyces]|uniref:winged helix-turn-helix domain-containing protein n=1 Tax=unclassified Streptomyces TaxID=2593676 RepID=UPI00278BB118|nr:MULTISPECIES: winged helix-turn-helix domain-containing protein [unclassified Streptomyces]